MVMPLFEGLKPNLKEVVEIIYVSLFFKSFSFMMTTHIIHHNIKDYYFLKSRQSPMHCQQLNERNEKIKTTIS